MAYPDPRVKGTNPILRVSDSWSPLDPFNGWRMLVGNVTCCGLTQTHGDPGHWALLWCFALMSKKVAPRLGCWDNHLLCLCYLHAVLLQLQNWNVILIAAMSHLSPRPVQRITYIYPCFSKFVQNLDWYNCISCRRLYLNLICLYHYRFSCDFIFESIVEYL